jgi:hypothetical protein
MVHIEHASRLWLRHLLLGVNSADRYQPGLACDPSNVTAAAQLKYIWISCATAIVRLSAALQLYYISYGNKRIRGHPLSGNDYTPET